MNLNRSGNYYLTQDIDASATAAWNGGQGFVPIGDSSTYFTGTFDGCGYVITGLTIVRNFWGQGLFGYCKGPAVIANVTVVNVFIKGGNYYCGALIAYCKTYGLDVLIHNCHASGLLGKHVDAGGMGMYGGLIGWADQQTAGNVKVYDCSSFVTINMIDCNNYSSRGGFIGIGSDMFIRNCFATGSLINGPGNQNGNSSLGGFAGSLDNCDISFCYATGNIEGGDSLVGGFLGNAAYNMQINSCYATGNVEAVVQTAGGFAGNIESDGGNPCNVSDCYAWGNVSAGNLAGGFVGVADDAQTTFTNCYTKGLIICVGVNKGGFDADSYITTVFNDCYWDKEASGIDYTDGSAQGKVSKWFGIKGNYPVTWDFDNIWYMPTFERQIIMGRPRSSYPQYAPHSAHRNVYG